MLSNIIIPSTLELPPDRDDTTTRLTAMLKYIELKSGQNDCGPAWIARVRLSRSKTVVYFNGKALARAHGIYSNHVDLATREWYWISNVKKRGNDRHWAGSGKVMIETSAIDEYLKITGRATLDHTRFTVIPDLPPTNIRRLHEQANEKLMN